jgi:hypothetical protein
MRVSAPLRPPAWQEKKRDVSLILLAPVKCVPLAAEQTTDGIITRRLLQRLLLAPAKEVEAIA